MAVVREDENKGFEGDDKFELHEKFNLIILCTYTDDESLLKITHSIPNWEDFSMFMVQDMTKLELMQAEQKRR